LSVIHSKVIIDKEWVGDMSLSDLDIGDIFDTSSQDLLNNFYIPCLNESILYKRAAGYFNSGLLALAPLAFADFVQRKGQIKLICNPSLNASDVESINNSEEIGLISKNQVYKDLVSIRDSDNFGAALSSALSGLIASNVLELKVLIPNNNKGIFHDKLGIFDDGINKLSFRGSANETAAAWLEGVNLEGFDVNKSWIQDNESKRIARHEIYFQELWNGPRGWRFISREEIKSMAFSISPPEDLNNTFENLKKLIGKRVLPKNNKGNSKIYEPKKLQEHQVEVLKNWNLQNQRGIITFATGGGKTLTAISAIREWGNSNKPSLVIVPTKLLHLQWMSELRREIPGVSILPLGGGFPMAGKESLIRNATKDSNSVILATYNAASSDIFLRSALFTKNLLIVADEVHKSGTPTFKKFLEKEHDGPRLGLSATPERYNSEEETQNIFDYFGNKLPPSFGILEAIKAGRRVSYEYDFELVSLTTDEQSEWNELTKKIQGMVAQEKKSGNESEFLTRLRSKRAMIAKKSISKISIARRLLKSDFEIGDRWLIYCADQEQLRQVRNTIMDLNITILEFHQQMVGGRVENIDLFSREGGVMLAIKCLDEGIDIPLINKALILASSANPREYIQRRGRVLRTHPNKDSAKIWDVLVCDTKGSLLTINEAKRAKEFAYLSRSVSTRIKLESILSVDSQFEDEKVGEVEDEIE
jgi:superfamily II DNA or RNA helicase